MSIAETADLPYVRPPELLVPTVRLPHARSFMFAVDAFMGDAEHKLFRHDGHHGGWLDHYSEGEDIVHSLIHQPNDPSPAHIHQATSIVMGGDGRIYADWHLFSAEGFFPRIPGTKPRAGINHRLRAVEWQQQIIPITYAIGHGLLKIVR